MKEQIQQLIVTLSQKRADVLTDYLNSLALYSKTDFQKRNDVLANAGILNDLDYHLSRLNKELEALNG